MNIKLFISQINKLKLAVINTNEVTLKITVKNANKVTLKLSSNMIGNSNDETNFPHNLLLTDRHVSKIRKSFANNSSDKIKLSKTQLSKIVQSGEFLGSLFRPLIKVGLPLMKNILKSFDKIVSIPLRLTATTASAQIHKKSYCLRNKDTDNFK